MLKTDLAKNYLKKILSTFKASHGADCDFHKNTKTHKTYQRPLSLVRKVLVETELLAAGAADPSSQCPDFLENSSQKKAPLSNSVHLKRENLWRRSVPKLCEVLAISLS